MFRRLVSLLAGVALFASAAAAAPMPWPGNTIVAGWEIRYDNNAAVTLEDMTPGTLTISIESTLRSATAGQVPTSIIQFIGPAENTISRIVISSEAVLNETGFGWTDYRWEVVPNGLAGFDYADSAWTVTPLGPVDSGSWRKIVGDKAGSLQISGLPVPDGATFNPHGSLVIDVSNDPITFDLKQIAIPEPATLLLVAPAAVAALGRRTRRRCRAREPLNRAWFKLG